MVCIVSIDTHRFEEGLIGTFMGDVLSEVVSSLEAREQVVLATIVSSDGSSPLPAGAMMLVRPA